MFSKINAFIQQLNNNNDKKTENKLTIEIACAVLFCEVMKADGALHKSEMDFIKVLLLDHFPFSPDEIEEILTIAIKLSEDASDFYQFTVKINEHYSIDERMKIVGNLWKLAYVDGDLANFEEHIIRKIADLLHLRHSEYIQTKLSNTPR